jgi:hypothetical protein
MMVEKSDKFQVAWKVENLVENLANSMVAWWDN